MKKTLQVLERLVENDYVTMHDLMEITGNTGLTKVMNLLNEYGVDISKRGNIYYLNGFNHELRVSKSGCIVTNYNNKKKISGYLYKPNNWFARMIYKLKKYLGWL